MSAPPFSDFLEVLRAKNLGVGLHEHLALGKLLAGWTDTSRDDFRDAVAALIARHDDDVVAIKRVFDECYPDRLPVAQSPSDARILPPTTDDRWLRLIGSRHARLLAVATIVLIAIGAVAVRRVVLRPPSGQAVPSSAPPPSVPVPPTTTTDAAVAVPTASALPALQPPVDWTGVSWLAAGTLLAALLPMWMIGLRRRADRWRDEAWREAMGRLPGPFHPQFSLRDLHVRLPRTDVEDAAILLGRSFMPGHFSRELDVTASLRRTLAEGLQPHLVFRARRAQRVVLVLQDVSQSMDMHTRRLDALCGDLTRQGIAIERMYFDGDPGAPAKRAFGAPIALDALLRSREHAPVLVLSTGFGAIAALRRADRGWLTALQRHSDRVWISPVTDTALWPDVLSQLAIPVLPLTREGLLRAATLLSRGESAQPSLKRVVTRVRAVTPQHVRTLRQIASLVPDPTPELLEVLRQRFTPDIPESAVVQTVGRRTGYANVPFTMTDADIRQALSEIRAENPQLERATRQYLLLLLDESRPEPGSAASLRWIAAVAVHRVHLAELDGRQDATWLQQVSWLSNGPLRDEVRGLVDRQPEAAAATRALRAITMAPRRDDPAHYIRSRWGVAIEPFRFGLPNVAQVILAAAVALVVGGAVTQLSAFRVPARIGPDVFGIAYVEGAPGFLQLQRVGAENRQTQSITLYRNDAVAEQLPADLTVPFRVPIDNTQGSAIYQVRTVLGNGAVSVSNAIWAPSRRVTIDAQPWANVTVSSAVPGFVPIKETTPLVVNLPEGQFQIRLENGGLTAERSETVVVSAGGERRFTYVMPGFQPADLVDRLLPTKARSSAKKY